MRKVRGLAVVFALSASGLSADSTFGPALQWVKTMGGSGTNQVTAAAADAPGLRPDVLVADPFHAGVLYAGLYSGIFQSTDAGATWTKKASGRTGVIAADVNSPVLCADLSGHGMVRSSDGFSTSAPVGPPETSLAQIAVAGPSVFGVAAPSTDAFVVKLDSNGAVVYSTYFGGSAGDSVVAIALASDGSVYVAGATISTDFPATTGAYAQAGSNFVFKLNPDGSLAWSTLFADSGTTVAAIAVDAAGNPYIAGTTSGGRPE